MTSKLKKKSRKKEETAAATTAATAPEAAAGKENDSTTKTKKKGDDDIVEKPTTTKKKKGKGKPKTKKGGDDDADGGGVKKEGSKKRKKDKSKKSADGAAAAAAAATAATKSKKKSGGKKKDSGSGGSKKLSAQTLAMHKKWQDAATDLGGGKIIINKIEAKKAIFDMLHDAFRPMNITQIHTSLKGVVPSPVLKSCLEEMVIDTAGGDDGSDDEDDKPKKSTKSKKGGDGGGGNGGDPSTTDYVDSLRIKSGRNANNVLYFTNHDTSVNGGNGLPPDERNELIGAEKKSAQDLQSSRDNLKAIQNLTTKLLSEPTNQEAKDGIAKEEKVLADLKASVEESRQYAGNEKKREQTKKRIRDLAHVWWTRRRMCNDFLQGMEDATEGTISVKKCLAGDGQIDIDSDEAVIAAEKEMHEYKKAKKAKSSGGGSGGGDIQPTDTFIGVKFDGVGHVKRVHVSEG